MEILIFLQLPQGVAREQIQHLRLMVVARLQQHIQVPVEVAGEAHTVLVIKF